MDNGDFDDEMDAFSVRKHGICSPFLCIYCKNSTTIAIFPHFVNQYRCGQCLDFSNDQNLQGIGESGLHSA